MLSSTRKKVIEVAEGFTSKKLLGANNPVAREHQIAFNCLIAAILFCIAGKKRFARKYFSMWQYLRKIKQ